MENVREVIAIVRREKAREVKELLLELGLEYVSRSVLGKGKEGGIGFSTDKGILASAVPKTMIITWVEDALCRDVVERIINVAYTGAYGDGKIFVLGGDWR
ncbi:MAG: P-II family nitrogen regulator [Aquificaceae bacterium]|nr:P-II family nitrogen regulator [Aquificaceae bacterium]